MNKIWIIMGVDGTARDICSSEEEALREQRDGEEVVVASPPAQYSRNRYIRELREAGHTYEQLAEKFGISRQRAFQICNPEVEA